MWELWGLFSSSFISSTIAPGGSEAVLAYLASTGRYNVLELVTTATIGNTLGALTTWFLGWLAAKKYPIQKLLDSKHQQSIGHVQRWGVWALLFSWLPVIGDGFCFAAGWMKLNLIFGTLLIFTGKAVRYYLVAAIFT